MADLIELLTEAGLPADVAEKVDTLFSQKLDEGVLQRLEEQKLTWATEQATKIETFLEGVISEWATANEEALQESVKQEILDESLNALRGVLGIDAAPLNEAFENRYRGEVEALKNQLSTLSQSLNEANQQLQESTEKVGEYERAEIFVDLTESLSVHGQEQVQKLVADLKFDSNEAFKSHVTALVESFKDDKGTEAGEGGAGKMNEGHDQNLGTGGTPGQGGGDAKLSLAEIAAQQMTRK